MALDYYIGVILYSWYSTQQKKVKNGWLNIKREPSGQIIATGVPPSRSDGIQKRSGLLARAKLTFDRMIDRNIDIAANLKRLDTWSVKSRQNFQPTLLAGVRWKFYGHTYFLGSLIDIWQNQQKFLTTR